MGSRLPHLESLSSELLSLAQPLCLQSAASSSTHIAQICAVCEALYVSYAIMPHFGCYAGGTGEAKMQCLLCCTVHFGSNLHRCLRKASWATLLGISSMPLSRVMLCLLTKICSRQHDKHASYTHCLTGTQIPPEVPVTQRSSLLENHVCKEDMFLEKLQEPVVQQQ